MPGDTVTVKTKQTNCGHIWQKFVMDENGKYVWLERSQGYYSSGKAAKAAAARSYPYA